MIKYDIFDVDWIYKIPSIQRSEISICQTHTLEFSSDTKILICQSGDWVLNKPIMIYQYLLLIVMKN